MSKHAYSAGSNADADFLGWQQTLSGEIFPLYTITVADHPSYHSTVSEGTLRKLRLRIPRTPSPYPDPVPPPWQSIGVELDHPKTAREAIETAGLDYTVVKKPLELNSGLKHDAYAVIRTDTEAVLGIVGKNYEPVQNRDAFTFFDSLIDEQEAVYETAGMLGEGETVWILAKVPGFIKVNRNDIVNKYILLTNSHDGTSQVRAKLTPIRVVCNNTLTSALRGAGEIQIHHTSNTARHLEQAITLLGMSDSLFEHLGNVFDAMAMKTITEEQLQEYVHALIPDSDESKETIRTAEIRNDVLRLHHSGLGAHLARGTLWGAFNSVTEYTDHRMLTEDSTTRLKSIWFGRGEQLKLKAFQLAERVMQA